VSDGKEKAMTDDDVRNTMQFILEQQAQLTVTVGQLSESVDRLTGKVDQLTGKVDQLTDKVDRLADKVDRTADSTIALLAIAEIHEREIETLKESTAANAEAGRATDERLNALIDVVEQMISERRNGGDRPA
jgi:X-X-X-Leu-X-X-Gly heptad repeat protein